MGESRTSTSTFHTALSCCFMSTETMQTIKDGDPRTSTAIFAQILSSSFTLLYVHRDPQDY